MGILLKVWGDMALFTRPEFKAERVSYDVLTPTAALGILQAIYSKPQFRWVIDSIHVYNPIRFISIKRNEIKRGMSKGTKYLYAEDNRMQRSSLILTNVCYGIEAHIIVPNGNDADYGKHLGIFTRRVENGQCYRTPCFGLREFGAEFSFNHGPENTLQTGEKDLGWMPYSTDDKGNTRLFRAVMVNGVVDCRNKESFE